MIDKTDNALNSVNDFLKTVTDRITPNVVLLISIVNGFLIGLATTGYLGDKSLAVWSLSFFLIIWQLLVICVFSSRYIELTTSYLNKFIVSGAIGYIWQWQFFGMYAIWDNPDITTIVPPMENKAIGFMFGYFTLMILAGYCFKGNKKNTSAKLYELPKDKDVA